MIPTPIQSDTIILLPPDALEPVPDQPRQERDPAFVRELADNIQALRLHGQGLKGTGVLEPLLVRVPALALDDNGRLKPDKRLPIVSGETRWRAALLANDDQPNSIPLLPVVVQNLGADDAFELAYHANAQRRQMSALDEGLALLRIKRRHRLGYERLAARVNHSKDYVRERLKAVGQEDTWPLLEQRPGALSIVRRINQVRDPVWRAELIQLALRGASKEEVEDQIAARRAGLPLERFRAEKPVRRLERAAAREAKAAAPVALPSAKTLSRSPASEQSPAGSGSSENDWSGNGLFVRPFIGDVLDVLLRQMEDAKTGLLEARLSGERRADLLAKARRLRALAEELIRGLERGS